MVAKGFVRFLVFPAWGNLRLQEGSGLKPLHAGWAIKKAAPPVYAGGAAYIAQSYSKLGICLLVRFLDFRLDTAAGINRVTVLPGPLAYLRRVLVTSACSLAAGRASAGRLAGC